MMPMTWMLVVLLSKNFADSLHIDEDDANDLDVGRRATTASWRRM